MSKLFKNEVDIENGVVYKLDKKGFIGMLDKYGYIHCKVRDKFGNFYRTIHQVIFAEAHNLPKHLWPIDKEGRRFEIDHIDAVRTNNKVENLRLVSKKENNNNTITKKNKSEAKKGRHISEETKQKMSEAQKNDEKKSKQVYQYTLNRELIRIWPSAMECGRNGYKRGHVCDCCRGMRKTHKGYRWSYEPL